VAAYRRKADDCIATLGATASHGASE